MPLNEKPNLVLPPPVFEVSSLTNKYQLVLDLKWGEYKSQVFIDQELGSFTWNLTNALNKALLVATESNPMVS